MKVSQKNLIGDLDIREGNQNTAFLEMQQFGSNSQSFKLHKLGVFWNHHMLLLMMATEILKIDAS